MGIAHFSNLRLARLFQLLRFSMKSSHISCLFYKTRVSSNMFWCNDMQMCFVASVDIADIVDVSSEAISLVPESERPPRPVTRETGPDKARVSGHSHRLLGQTHRQWSVSPGANTPGDIIIISVISVKEDPAEMFGSQL